MHCFYLESHPRQPYHRAMAPIPHAPMLIALISGCSLGLDKLGETGAAEAPGFQGWGDDENGEGEQGSDGEAGDADDSPSGDPGTGDEPPSNDDGPDDSDSDDEADEDADEPVGDSDLITAISPQHGSTLGGTRVAVRGGPFPEGTEIEIGGIVVSVTDNVGDELRFETPPYSGEGWAELATVHPDGSRHSWSEGFHFWQDGTGLAGAAGYYQWVQPVGGYWIDGVPPDPWGGANIVYLVPEDFYWWELVTGTLGTCTASDSTGYDGELFLYDFGEPNLRLENEYGSTTLLTFDDASKGFGNEAFTAGNFIASHSYASQPFTSLDAPPDSIANFVETPATFRVSNPNIDSLYVPNITRSQTVTWDAGGADVVWIEMARVNSLGTAIEEGIICIVSDSGSFTVPASAWASWPTGRQVNLVVTKARVSRALLPHNNSESRVSGMYSVFGAGFSL